MKLGFVGTGVIAKAIIVGLLDDDPTDISVVVSPRNAATAADLAKRFPRHLAVAASNQAVLDATDVVVIAVLPGIARKLLADLRFRSDHLVLSLAATITIDEIAEVVAPATHIVRAIPLPSAAEKASPTAILPSDPIVKAIFDRTGRVIETADARAFDAMGAASGVMAGHFAAWSAVAEWLANQGLDGGEANTYARLMLAGLAGTAGSGCRSFDELAAEHATPGGLNEQFRAHLEAHHMRDAIQSGLDDLLTRIEKAAMRST